MASLMQEFAAARQRRLEERADFLAEQQMARVQRAKDLQAQSEATAKYLAHAKQSRLAWEQGRQAIAENSLESRREEITVRASQVSEYLTNLHNNRVELAHEDNERRAQEVRTRTFKTRSQLKHIHKARIRASKADQAQRQQFVQDLAALTQMQLEDLHLARLAETKADAAQRAQEFSDRVAKVKASLGTTAAARHASAMAQALKLKDFRSQLSESVWAGSRSNAITPVIPKLDANPVGNPSNSPNPPSVIEPPPEPVIAKPVEVKENPKNSSKIEQFVVDYVSQLSTNSSLLEVVNDRDTVRDLLAQGANTLKVDPSDILNTLLQMAEGSST
ncbi:MULTISPECIES: hypothetical protein [Pseudanabaena]|uniref:Gas vesicle protein GvpC n=2 Tax=Pseudanabaena TaxID=1152 RepID=L8N2E2_9CYAN|nr:MULTISPECIES: hypothetical protein [Pseudanabaena]ELS32910.1 hypothetical protein Pse7429DRAFT_1821 [Pseudanabaena biceps PCC 7429]MDG3494879.1 hypothetical protein [Pseudanabaena catenata USMAC16]